MKRNLLLLAACMVVFAGFAQPNQPDGQTRPARQQWQAEGPPARESLGQRPQSATPEQIAERRTETMREELNLTEKQYKKVYKVNLKQVRKAQSAMQTSAGGNFGDPTGAPPRGGMPGGGMGMRGGGGMSGGGAGISGSGMPSEGGRMSGGRQGGPPVAASNVMGGFYEESEKEIAAREKSMKKILSAEQFAKWQKMDVERRRDDMRRQFDRQAMPSGKFDREAMPARQ